MTKRPHTKANKPLARAWSEDDAWVDEVAVKAAEEMARWLKGSLHLSRPISSLTRLEMKALALAAIDTWVVNASRRLLTTVDEDEKSRLNTLLM